MKGAQAPHKPSHLHPREPRGTDPGEKSLYPSSQVIDGRVLDAQDGSFKRINNKEESHTSATLMKGSKLNAAAGRPHNAHPMTPPLVSGVSLAPMPDAELLHDLPAQAGGQQHADSGPAGRLYKKAAPLRLAIPPNALAAEAAAAKGASESGKQPRGAEPLQLRAEGKKLQQQRSVVPLSMVINSLEINPNQGYYMDINDTDSLCSTPPVLHMDSLTRDCGLPGPLGPLTPLPISPSMFTVCKDMGTALFDLDKATLHASDPELHGEDSVNPAAFKGNSEDGNGGPWGSFSRLPDMRFCESPKIPSH